MSSLSFKSRTQPKHGKFETPDVTARGERRADVALESLRTLWFNTGTLCNLTCVDCYIESSPTNDRLVYLSRAEVADFLAEIEDRALPVREVGFTGGEPFMNPDILGMLEDALSRGHDVLVLTNAMKPLHHRFDDLLDLKGRFDDKLAIRVSIDHYSRDKHEAIRGENTWTPMLRGLKWLAENAFNMTIAGRTCWNEGDGMARSSYAALFKAENIPVNASDPSALVLFPEMDNTLDVPEITTHCWDILGVAPETMMCATSRMVIKRKGGVGPLVVPCTLLPYDPTFELGQDLGGSSKTVQLNHPHCARFCVLGGASCSG